MQFDPTPTANHTYYLRLAEVLAQADAQGACLRDIHGALSAWQVERLALATLRQQADVRQVVEGWLRAGLSMEDLYLQGIANAARLLGDWWVSDELDFATLTVASYRLHQVIHDLSPMFVAQAERVRHGHCALLVATPGSHHTLGVLMLSEFFRREGWHVTREVPDTPEDLLRWVATDWYDLVGISVNADQTREDVRALVAQVRHACANPHLTVMVGGLIMDTREGYAQAVGADFLGEDARTSQQQALESVLAKLPVFSRDSNERLDP